MFVSHAYQNATETETTFIYMTYMLTNFMEII